MKYSFIVILFLIINAQSQYPNPQLIVPDNVGLRLNCKIINGEKQPILTFRYKAAYGSDHWVSNLIVNQICYKDSIKFDIQGYYYLDNYQYYKDNKLVIIPDELSASKSIVIPTSILYLNDSIKIIIKLKGKRNVFYISQDDLIISLNPVDLENIRISENTDKNYNKLLLFPPDTYRIYIAGKVNRSVNYESSIVKFADSLGFTLAKTKYPQIPTGFNHTNLYFIRKDSLYLNIPRVTARRLGYLPDHPDVEVIVASQKDHCAYEIVGDKSE